MRSPIQSEIDYLFINTMCLGMESYKAKRPREQSAAFLSVVTGVPKYLSAVRRTKINPENPVNPVEYF